MQSGWKIRVSGPLLVCVLLGAGLFGCARQPPPGVLSAADFPGFQRWLAHAGGPTQDDTARQTAQLTEAYAQALANLDGPALSEALASAFIQHNPLLEDGPQGILRYTQQDGAPRGAAPNLMAGTAHLLIDGRLALVHRVGQLGPLQSHNMDLLRFDDAGKLAEHWSFLQPVEAGFIDNMLFSFVVPRALDLIPTANSGDNVLWSDLPGFADLVSLPPTVARDNATLVSEYLDGLYAGADTDALTGRYLAPDFVLHAPGVPAGRAGYSEVLSRAKRREDAAQRELLIAQNDLVWVLTRIREIREADVPEVASADLFRVRNGSIVEQWKVVQPSPRFAKNDNGIF